METTKTILKLSELINNNDSKQALILLDKLIEFKSHATTKDSHQSWYTLLKRFKALFFYLYVITYRNTFNAFKTRPKA